MAPWEELGWFNLPDEKPVVLTQGSIYPIESDPHRIWLAVTTDSGNYLYMRRPTGLPNSTNTIGFPISNILPLLIFRHKDDPGLPMLQWEINNPNVAAQRLYVMRLSMKDWPRLTQAQNGATLTRGEDGRPPSPILRLVGAVT